MKIKTREDALLHCIDLWLWLALHPEKTKIHWPGWKFNGGYLQEYTALCPCCAYTHNIGKDCTHCPIQWCKDKNKWFNPCLADDSPYRKWTLTRNFKNRTKLALKIVELAIEAL